jgi:hypothetical protein
MPSRDGTRPAEPAGLPRVYLEGLGRQVDHAPACEVAQDADARHLQDVRDVVGLEPGQGAKARLPVWPGDVRSVDPDGVQPRRRALWAQPHQPT